MDARNLWVPLGMLLLATATQATTDPVDSDGDGLSDQEELTPQAPIQFEVVNGTFTWPEAKADAERRGGFLATVTSLEEWDKLLAILPPVPNAGTHNFWLGATDEVSEGDWRWVTGEPFTFQLWGTGEPNNCCGGEHFLAATPTFWNDAGSRENTGSVTDIYILEHDFSSDPAKADTDGDGLDDRSEVKVHHTFPKAEDSDFDGLNDGAEIARGSNPLNKDTDADGLSDGDEISLHKTDPLKSDTDGDGLADKAELTQHATDPTKADTDGDQFTDGIEVYAGKNPLDKNEHPGAQLNIYSAVEIEFFTLAGARYQVQTSPDLQTWTNQGEPITGDGNIFRKLYSVRGQGKLFHRVEKLP